MRLDYKDITLSMLQKYMNAILNDLKKYFPYAYINGYQIINRGDTIISFEINGINNNFTKCYDNRSFKAKDIFVEVGNSLNGIEFKELSLNDMSNLTIINIDEENQVLQFDKDIHIEFDYYHCCCEYNYANLNILKTYNIHTKTGKETSIKYEKFNLENDDFYETVDGMGFNLISNTGCKFFVPCYSEQNGYYTDKLDDINIYQLDIKVRDLKNIICEMR